MFILHLLINLAEWLLFAYFGFAACYVLFYSLAGLFPFRCRKVTGMPPQKIALVIPGFRDDTLIVGAASNALDQKYPDDRLDVVVIAGSLQAETRDELGKLPVRLLDIPFGNNKLSEVMNETFAALGEEYDIVLIMNPGDRMTEGYLNRISDAFHAGHPVIQGRRIVRNAAGSLALLDAISNDIDNRLYLKGHRVVGLSGMLCGSGMAFRFDLLKKWLREIEPSAVYEKELQVLLHRDGIRVEYLPEAVSSDIRVRHYAENRNRRRHRISTQLSYFRKYAWDGLIQLIARFNVDYFDKLYQMIQPSRMLLLAVVTLFTAVMGILSLVDYIWTWETFSVQFMNWLVVWFFTVAAIALAVPRRHYNLMTFKAVFALPVRFWLTFKPGVKKRK